MIFMILVSHENVKKCVLGGSTITSKTKINVFWKKIELSGLEGAIGVKKKFQETLILVFEVIVQPPKTHFLTFSCETKIMKITHSAPPAGETINLNFHLRPKSWKSHIVKQYEYNYNMH